MASIRSRNLKAARKSDEKDSTRFTIPAHYCVTKNTVFNNSSQNRLTLAAHPIPSKPSLSSQPDHEMPRTFPPDFMWGTATASFQIEGASKTHRVPSIWDAFCDEPGNIHGSDTGERACDHYNRFRDDVKLISSLNTKHYRFSIAWPRIHKFTEDGDISGVNEDGIRFYGELIDALLAAGITPVVTLYHWDLPLVIDKVHGGWKGTRKIVELFGRYAETCFAAFGDRVKHWITLNEPWCSAFLAYEIGEHAPGKGIPSVDIYKAGHNLLLAHARAVQLYRTRFREEQQGVIGITLNTSWAEPMDPSDEACVKAAERDMAFELGWFADVVYMGDYPECMRSACGSRLPVFTEEERRLLKGSSDFFGLNHYSTLYSAGLMSDEEREQGNASYGSDKGTVMRFDPEWKTTDMGWAIVPWGFRKLLEYIQRRYDPPGGIIVTENGLASQERTREEMEADTLRVGFYESYIGEMHEAMRRGVDVRGYFLWSLMDNFEWAFGYEKRFGLHWVDYETMERVPKPAVEWYRAVVERNGLDGDGENEKSL